MPSAPNSFKKMCLVKLSTSLSEFSPEKTAQNQGFLWGLELLYFTQNSVSPTGTGKCQAKSVPEYNISSQGLKLNTAQGPYSLVSKAHSHRM